MPDKELKKIMLRVSPELYARILATARYQRKSMNQWISEQLVKQSLPYGVDRSEQESEPD